MTRNSFAAAVAALLLSSTLALATPPPLGDLHRAVHETLGLPEPAIVRLLDRGLPEPELPAVGWIAHQTGAPVERIANLRRGGMPFVDIALHLGSGPEIFYVPFDADPGPPYGKAWGYYRNRPRANWRAIRLADVDVVHLSHLKLMSRHYGVPAARVVELERRRLSPASLHRELAAERGATKVKGPARGPKPSQAKAHGVDKGKPAKQHGKPAKSPKPQKPPR